MDVMMQNPTMDKRKAMPIQELFEQFKIQKKEGQMYVVCIVDGMLENENEDEEEEEEEDEDFSFPQVFIEV